MSNTFEIAAKKLGQMAMPDACPRCFWTLTHFKGETPFSIFPPIFNDIDRYTKLSLHTEFDDTGVAPTWLSGFGDLVNYIDPPHHSKFKFAVNENVTIKGEADAIFKRSDGKLVICDYKTANFRGTNDTLLPIYEIQLNAYAWLAESLGYGNVAALYLLYMEPQTSADAARLKVNRRDDGFAMGLRCHPMEIAINTKKVLELAETAFDIFAQVMAPAYGEKCKNCLATQQLIALNKAVFPTRQSYALI